MRMVKVHCFNKIQRVKIFESKDGKIEEVQENLNHSCKEKIEIWHMQQVSIEK